MSVRFISADSIRSCPWTILAPEHYRREDGSCRCDDPNHTEMVEWGYVWDDANGRWGGDEDAAA